MSAHVREKLSSLLTALSEAKAACAEWRMLHVDEVLAGMDSLSASVAHLRGKLVRYEEDAEYRAMVHRAPEVATVPSARECLCAFEMQDECICFPRDRLRFDAKTSRWYVGDYEVKGAVKDGIGRAVSLAHSLRGALVESMCVNEDERVASNVVIMVLDGMSRDYDHATGCPRIRCAYGVACNVPCDEFRFAATGESLRDMCDRTGISYDVRNIRVRFVPCVRAAKLYAEKVELLPSTFVGSLVRKVSSQGYVSEEGTVVHPEYINVRIDVHYTVIDVQIASENIEDAYDIFSLDAPFVFVDIICGSRGNMVLAKNIRLVDIFRATPDTTSEHEIQHAT